MSDSVGWNKITMFLVQMNKEFISVFYTRINCKYLDRGRVLLPYRYCRYHCDWLTVLVVYFNTVIPYGTSTQYGCVALSLKWTLPGPTVQVSTTHGTELLIRRKCPCSVVYIESTGHAGRYWGRATRTKNIGAHVLIL